MITDFTVSWRRVVYASSLSGLLLAGVPAGSSADQPRLDRASGPCVLSWDEAAGGPRPGGYTAQVWDDRRAGMYRRYQRWNFPASEVQAAGAAHRVACTVFGQDGSLRFQVRIAACPQPVPVNPWWPRVPALHAEPRLGLCTPLSGWVEAR